MREAFRIEVFDHIRASKRKPDPVDLDTRLQDFGLYGNWRQCYNWYCIYKESQYHTLPFSGGLAAQPVWLVENFAIFGLIESWLKVNSDKPSEASLGDWTSLDI